MTLTLFLSWVAIVMALVFLALVVTIVGRRLFSDRRSAREHSLRPAIETLLDTYLAAEEPERPLLPAGRRARGVVRTVALEELTELSGRERARLVLLLECSGIVAETAVGLGSRRRRVRRAAAEALRQIGSEESLGSLSVGLEDPDIDAALACAAGLAELSDETCIPRVMALAEGAAVARPGAVAAILVTMGQNHPTALGQALRPDARIELRRLATAVVGGMRLAEHVEALHAGLGDADDELAARAARGLGMIGDDSALEALVAIVDDEDRAWFLRLAATEALGEIGDPRAAPPLEQELNADAWALQAKAAKALRLLGAAGEAALGRSLVSPVEQVREHARVALER